MTTKVSSNCQPEGSLLEPAPRYDVHINMMLGESLGSVSGDATNLNLFLNGMKAMKKFIKKFISFWFDLYSKWFKVHWKVNSKIYNFYVDDKLKFWWFGGQIEVWSWLNFVSKFFWNFLLLLCKVYQEVSIGFADFSANVDFSLNSVFLEE